MALETESGERDQIEEGINMMIYLFLQIACKILLEFYENIGMEFAVAFNTDRLTVSVGGFFITTKPDLKVELRKVQKLKWGSITILDHDVINHKYFQIVLSLFIPYHLHLCNRQKIHTYNA